MKSVLFIFQWRVPGAASSFRLPKRSSALQPARSCDCPVRMSRNVAPELPCQIFVLIDRQEIHPGANRSTPANERSLHRTKIVGVRPAIVAFSRGRGPIQRMESNPKAMPVSVAHKLIQASLTLSRPFARPVLPFPFDDAPRIIPPAAIIIHWLRSQNLRWRGRIPIIKRGCAEGEQPVALGHLMVKDLLLRLRFAGQNQNRFYIEQRDRMNVPQPGGAGDPIRVFAKQVPDSFQMFRLFAFEVRIESDLRPIAPVGVLQRLFHDGAHAFEEVVLQRPFKPSGVFAMRQNRPSRSGSRIDVPGQILFNSQRRAGA